MEAIAAFQVAAFLQGFVQLAETWLDIRVHSVHQYGYGRRRAARESLEFEPHGHSPGLYELPAETPDKAFPMTLDLRRVK